MRPSAFAPTKRRTFMLALVLVAVLSLVFAGSAFADFWTPESGGSPNADRIDSLYKLILIVAAVVFFGVEGALLYSLLKFRARKGAVAAQIHGNTRLEIGWTVGAAVILVVLAVFTFVKLPGIRDPENSDPNGLQLTASTGGVAYADATRRLPPNGKSLNVCVNGQQYIWRFTYAEDCKNSPLDSVFSYEKLVVPTGTTVTLDITAQDVAHSWWVPKLGGKFDAVPGYTNHTWFKVPAKLAGQSFHGQCAELCGRNHANMIADVQALSPQDFQQWFTRQKAAIKAADAAAAQQRKQVDQEPGQGTPTP